MVPESSSPVDDDGAAGLGFLSFRDRALSRRNLKQHQEQGNVSSDRPVTRSRSNLGRSDSRRWSAFSRRSFFVFAGFALLLLFMVSFYLESLMTSVFLERSEKAWSRDSELKLGMTLKFVPQRIPRKFIEDEVDQLHSEDRFGFRKPRLALILRNMEKDSLSLLLITVMKNMKELGYAFEIFAVGNGEARQMWQELGRLVLLSPKQFVHINWLLFEGIIVDSFEGKEAITSIMLEPFCSIPLIWIIQDDILAKRLKMYKDRGWENLVSHWRSTFSRASVIVFPNFALPMLYSALDTGNFHVIHGSPVDVWTAEIYKKTHFKYQLGKKLGFGVEDIIVLVVGNSFYDELSPEYAVALNRMGPVLINLPRKNPEVSFKFVFLCGNSTNGCNGALQETASRLGLPRGYLSHYGFDEDVNGILYFADIVLYESSHNVQDFPPLLVRAMTFEVPIVAPDLPIINQYVVEGFHGLLFPKFSSDALIRALTDLSSTSIGRLTRIANNIALSGRLLAKNILASECVTGYANLLEEVLNFPSDVILPGSITQLPEAVWEWDLFWNELIQVSPSEQHDESVKKKPSVVIKLEEEFSDLVSPLNISNPEKEILLHDIPTQQDWDVIGEIERTEEYDRVEMEELQERTESIIGSWERIYRSARKSERMKLENAKDEGELERAGQIVCIYEIYSGPGAWPFLHHGALFRGLSLSRRALRLKSDDVSAPQQLPLLKNRFYQDILCEIGGMFAIANKIDTIHRRPWIGFQSWQADGRKVSLSKKAGKILEEAIQENPRGEAIYFWAYLEVESGVIDSDDGPFWYTCDVFNRGHCCSTFKDAFRQMYGLPPSHSEALPPMPDDGGLWSSLHSWVMPTPTFLEFIMFSRMFVDSIDAVNGKLANVGECSLASSGLERRQCYCRVLGILINVWAYHSGRRMVYLNPRSGSLEEQHPLEERQDFMWSKFFNITLLKAMDADLAEAADDNDPPRRRTWLWPLTGEVFWEGIYEREEEEKYRQKMEKRRMSREKNLDNLLIHQHKAKATWRIEDTTQ